MVTVTRCTDFEPVRPLPWHFRPSFSAIATPGLLITGASRLLLLVALLKATHMPSMLTTYRASELQRLSYCTMFLSGVRSAKH